MNIGKKIEALRKENGLTQLELATKSGISRNAIYNYENNKRIPQIDVLQRIVVALDCSLNDVFDESLTCNSIGEKIKKYRKESGLTQQELAEKINKNIRTVQKYESGEIEIPLGCLFKICSLFGIDINEIIEGDIKNDFNNGQLDNLSILNKNMKSIIKNKGLTIKELALKSGMSETAIYQYQSGLRCPSIRVLYNIANALGVTQSELLGEPKKEIEIQSFADSDLIEELKKRGYIISKIF